MPKREYLNDRQRARVVEVYGRGGLTKGEVARQFGVTMPTVSAILRKAKEGTGMEDLLKRLAALETEVQALRKLRVAAQEVVDKHRSQWDGDGRNHAWREPIGRLRDAVEGLERLGL